MAGPGRKNRYDCPSFRRGVNEEGVTRDALERAACCSLCWPCCYRLWPGFYEPPQAPPLDFPPFGLRAPTPRPLTASRSPRVVRGVPLANVPLCGLLPCLSFSFLPPFVTARCLKLWSRLARLQPPLSAARITGGIGRPFADCAVRPTVPGTPRVGAETGWPTRSSGARRRSTLTDSPRAGTDHVAVLSSPKAYSTRRFSPARPPPYAVAGQEETAKPVGSASSSWSANTDSHCDSVSALRPFDWGSRTRPLRDN